MSMFNWDGQIVASQLSNMYAGEVFIDILRSRGEMQAADQRLVNLHHQYAQLVARYNNLADRHNAVLAENKRVDAARDEAIAEKDRRIAELELKNKNLDEDLAVTEDIVRRKNEYIDQLRERLQKGLP